MSNDLVISVSDIIDTYVFRVGLEQRNYSLSTAAGLFQSFIGMILVLITNGLARKFSLSGYKLIFKTKQIFVAYRNTILKTVIGTSLSLIISSLTAYPLSIARIKGRNFLSGIIFFTMLFSGGIIPTYLVIKDLHLLDTFWVYVIPGMMSAYNMFILRNYFSSIPSSLEESAMIDGANPFQILFRIILPLSKPALAAIAMFYGVGNWNSYMDGILYVNKQSLQLLQVCLRAMISVAGATNAISPVGTALNELAAVTDETMKMVVIMISVIPVLFAYPFLQKYYTKGVLVGSVKE
jgi:putative aldouronate transport system permease protein